jgi:hypothetical protein
MIAPLKPPTQTNRRPESQGLAAVFYIFSNAVRAALPAV